MKTLQFVTHNIDDDKICSLIGTALDMAKEEGASEVEFICGDDNGYSSVALAVFEHTGATNQGDRWLYAV